MKLKKPLLILTFLCISAASTYAQSVQNSDTPVSPVPIFTVVATQDADELKTQQQLLAELKFLRRENAALKEEVIAQKGELAASVRLIAIEKERGDFFKDAASKGIQVGNNSLALEMKYQEQINMFKDENNRLRSENKELRSSRNMRSILSFIGGAGTGYLACRR